MENSNFQRLIDVQNLSKRYKNFFALDNVSLSLNEGDIYGLVGRNGAGKTTLFKLIMGLSKATSGNMTIGQSDVIGLEKSRRQIGFMIGSSFFPYLNPYQNIEYFRQLKGISSKTETKRVLKLFGLYGVQKSFKSFSLGMKQRLGLANAFLGNPSIVILDEPINGLDPEGVQDMRNMIKEMNVNQGITFIISSHVLSELDLVATRFGFIEQGALIKEISSEELHHHTKKSLILKVDDVFQALQLLESELGIKNALQNKYGEIELSERIDEANLIARILVENKIELYKIAKQEMTLEEYFINLIGR